MTNIFKLNHNNILGEFYAVTASDISTLPLLSFRKNIIW